jgi:hypothetical protein
VSLALGANACTKKNPQGGEEAASGEADTHDGSATDPAAKPSPAAPGPDGRPPVLATVLPHDKGTVFGHFVVPNGARLLGKAKQQLMVPAYQGFLDEAALRSLASLQLPEKNKPLAQNIDISAPFGCALVDIKAYADAPMSCTFGYKGGVDQFVTDLGEADKQPDPGGHAGKFRFEGQDVFVDGLGDHVVVTAYDDVFVKTKTYLEKNLIERAASVRGDIEIVGYASDAFEFYRADIQPFLDEYAKMQQPPPTTSGHAGVDTALAVWTDYNKQSTQQSIERFSEMAQVTLYLGIEKIGLVGGGVVVPQPGSELEASTKRSGGTQIDPALTGSAPEGTVFLVSAATRPEAFDDPNAEQVRKVAAKSWASLTKGDPAAAEQALTEFLDEYKDMYAGHSMVAFVDVESAPIGGVVLAADLQSGKSTRDAFHAFTKKFTPDAVLGQEFSQYVSWSFDLEAKKVNGVPVDRFTIEPTPQAKKMLDQEMSEKDRAEVEKWFGGVRLIAHRAELDGRVVWTVAPKAEDAFTERVIAAQKGEGSLAADSGLSRLTGHMPASAVFGIDVRRTLSWLRGFPEIAPELSQVPQDLGTDVSDVFVTMQSRDDGVFVGELVISQPLIDQIKTFAANQAR